MFSDFPEYLMAQQQFAACDVVSMSIIIGRCCTLSCFNIALARELKHTDL